MVFDTVIIILQLIFLEGILSIDNAAVLGAMVARLPDDQHIVWPKPLHRLGAALRKVLGHQRQAALRVGLLGAYLGRGFMLLLAEFVIQNHWLRLIGALYLVRLAFDNLGQPEPGEAPTHLHPTSHQSFWAVVLAVELADLIFSLDNVVAAVALSKEFWVVMLGVAIGILLMRFAAGWFSVAVEREPILETAAYVLVLAIGIELLIEEFTPIQFGDWLKFGISILIILLALAYAHVPALRVIRPALVWLSEGFDAINKVVDWAFAPLTGLVRWIFSWFAPKPTEPSHHAASDD
jgi:tellurite resistance protein TerC